MNKQKKQLIILVAVLLAAVIAFVLVTKLVHDDGQEDETEKYKVTDMESDSITKL